MKKLSFAVVMILALALLQASATSNHTVKRVLFNAASAVWGT